MHIYYEDPLGRVGFQHFFTPLKFECEMYVFCVVEALVVHQDFRHVMTMQGLLLLPYTNLQKSRPRILY